MSLSESRAPTARHPRTRRQLKRLFPGIKRDIVLLQTGAVEQTRLISSMTSPRTISRANEFLRFSFPFPAPNYSGRSLLQRSVLLLLRLFPPLHYANPPPCFPPWKNLSFVPTPPRVVSYCLNERFPRDCKRLIA